MKKPSFNVKKTGAVLFLLMILVIPGTVPGQQLIDRIALGNTAIIESRILNENRYIYIYLPIGYEQSMEKYPVIYMLDGNFHFHHGSGVVQFLSATNRMPNSIVVAIPNTNRNRDFTLKKEAGMEGRGGADQFLAFMENEVLPFIEKKYRTQQYNILFGHSLTGMFVLYTLAKKPQLFNSYISASPYLAYDHFKVIDLLEELLDESPALNSTLYMTIGDEAEYKEGMNRISALLEEYPESGIEWMFDQLYTEDHSSTPHKTIYDGLEFIYKDWPLSNDDIKSLAAVEKHFKKISQKYGYLVKAPEALLNQLGYRMMGAGKMQEAIAVFNANVKKHPSSANVYDSIGEAYEKNEQLDLAIKNYQRAVDLGTRSNDRNLNIYKDNLFKAKMQQNMVRSEKGK